MKARFGVTLDLDVERYATSEGIEVHRVRPDAFAYVTASVHDLPGIANTDARIRWHVRHRKTLEPGARAPLARDGRMKLRLEFTIEADRHIYRAWAAIADRDARSDLIAYIADIVGTLRALDDAKVGVHWHNRPARPYRRTIPWPTRREDEVLRDS